MQKNIHNKHNIFTENNMQNMQNNMQNNMPYMQNNKQETNMQNMQIICKILRTNIMMQTDMDNMHNM